MWIAKLTLTTAFTHIDDAFATAFHSFSSRVGIVKSSALAEFYHAPKALLATLSVMGSVSVIATLLFFVALLINSLLNGLPAAPGRKAFAAGVFIAAIPVLVMMLAAQPTLIHDYFQFRGWGATVFAMLVAAILAGKRKTPALSCNQG